MVDVDAGDAAPADPADRHQAGDRDRHHGHDRHGGAEEALGHAGLGRLLDRLAGRDAEHERRHGRDERCGGPLSGRNSSGASRTTRIGRLLGRTGRRGTVVGLISRFAGLGQRCGAGGGERLRRRSASPSGAAGRSTITPAIVQPSPTTTEATPARTSPSRMATTPSPATTRPEVGPAAEDHRDRPPSTGPSAPAVARGRRRPGRARRGSRGGTCSGSRRARRGEGEGPDHRGRRAEAEVEAVAGQPPERDHRQRRARGPGCRRGAARSGIHRLSQSTGSAMNDHCSSTRFVPVRLLIGGSPRRTCQAACDHWARPGPPSSWRIAASDMREQHDEQRRGHQPREGVVGPVGVQAGLGPESQRVESATEPRPTGAAHRGRVERVTPSRPPVARWRRTAPAWRRASSPRDRVGQVRALVADVVHVGADRPQDR